MRAVTRTMTATFFGLITFVQQNLYHILSVDKNDGMFGWIERIVSCLPAEGTC
jgi:hypothetical protein